MEKLRKHKKMLLITSLITILPMLIGLLLWDKLPNEIATHFDINGTPDGWSSKTFTVFGLPSFLLICHLFGTAATLADPRRQQIGEKIFKLILWICPLITVFLSVTVYGHALGLKQNTTPLGMILIGIIFIVVGNYLPKCRQNYTIGIKVPWTLHDEENWNHTHRFAGKLWLLGGVCILILSIWDWGSLGITLGITVILAIIPALYSFIYYLKHR